MPVGNGPCSVITFPRWALATVVSRLSLAKNARTAELHEQTARLCILYFLFILKASTVGCQLVVLRCFCVGSRAVPKHTIDEYLKTPTLWYVLIMF